MGNSDLCFQLMRMKSFPIVLILSFSFLFLNCRKEIVPKPDSNNIDTSIVSMADSDFFEMINLEYEGLEKVKAAVNKKEYKAAIKAYAKFQKERQKPVYYYPKKIPTNYLSSNRLAPNSEAELMLQNIFTEENYSHQFKEEINWHFNPTDFRQNSNYIGTYRRDWTVLFNRMYPLRSLSNAFQKTGNPVYVEKIKQLINSWLVQAPLSKPGEKEDFWLSSWRSLEAGIRVGVTWPAAWQQSIQATEIDEETIHNWTKSWMEHGAYLEKNKGTLNWLTTESQGLFTVGVFFPEFKKATQWRTIALQHLQEQIKNDFYPDGAQVELSPEYHRLSTIQLAKTLQLASLNNLEVNPKFKEDVRLMLAYLSKISMPNRNMPRVNDTGTDDNLITLLNHIGKECYQESPELIWLANKGQAGTKPDYSSVVLPWAGQAVMREHWEEDANYLFFEYGPYGQGSHQHEDKLGIHMVGYGDLFVFEAGRENYGETPLRNYCLSSRAHSVITVGGLGQNRAAYRSKHERTDSPYPIIWSETEAFNYATATYGETETEPFGDHTFVKWQRHILYLRPDVFVLLDVLHPKDDKVHLYRSHFHLNADQANIETPTQRVVVQEFGRPSFSITPLNSDQLSTKIIKGQSEPEYLGWELFAGQEDRAIPTVQFEAAGSGSQFFAYVFKANPVGLGLPRPSIEQVKSTENQLIIKVSTSSIEGLIILPFTNAQQELKWEGKTYPTNSLLILKDGAQVYDLLSGLEY